MGEHPTCHGVHEGEGEQEGEAQEEDEEVLAGLPPARKRVLQQDERRPNAKFDGGVALHGDKLVEFVSSMTVSAVFSSPLGPEHAPSAQVDAKGAERERV